MGQPVTFLRTSSPRPGIVRFELNRTMTGMGHERYRAGQEILGSRAVDELARRMLATGRLSSVHIHGSVITAELAEADASDLERGDRQTSTRTTCPAWRSRSDEELIAMVEG